jgi:hypothetical protein
VAAFVINEWLWADLSGGNGRQAQREAFVVIQKLAVSDHRIVVIEGSAFDQKAWNLCKSTNPMIVQRMAGAYVASLRQNSDRCVILKPEAVLGVPNELASATKQDDHYLIQAQLSVEGAILVTTDGDLCHAVKQAGLPCLSRQEFLTTHL